MWSLRRAWAAVWCIASAAACRDTPPRAAPPSEGPSPVPGARSPVPGQWIWSDADLARWREARAAGPAVRPGLWVSTVRWDGGAFRQQLARNPRELAGAPAAAVVRFDESVHGAWAALPDSAVARALDERLRRLLPLVERAGGRAAEVQLDYDCPVRRLPRWAAVVGALTAPGGALAGREVWVTSLVAHVARPEYGPLFRPAARGHIVQLFDTGDVPSAGAADRLAAALARARMPFRVGLGAFERRGRAAGARAVTDHRGWFAALPALARVPGYEGVWIFPGGQAWRADLSSEAASPPPPTR